MNLNNLPIRSRDWCGVTICVTIMALLGKSIFKKILESGDILEHEIPYIVSEIGSYVYEIIEDKWRKDIRNTSIRLRKSLLM